MRDATQALPRLTTEAEMRRDPAWPAAGAADDGQARVARGGGGWWLVPMMAGGLVFWVILFRILFF